VRVRILTDGHLTDAKAVKYASRHAYQSLLEAGYEIYEYQPTMLHVKAMIVDGVWSVIGSANFDNRSFELNDELTIGVWDAQLAGSLVADFEGDMAQAKKLDVAKWGSERGFLEKARETFWSLFGEVF
jgi:cardiolipin synthase